MRAVVLAVVLAGCATQKPVEWVRTDGRPGNQADFLACKGETQKAALGTTTEAQIDCDANGCFSVHARQLNDVMIGCMAGRGYTGR
jgi:hypothetical protein